MATLNNTTRRLSPVGQECLKLYKEACARLLDLDEDGEIYEDDEDTIEALKREWALVMQTFEKSMQFTKALHVTNTKTAQELQDRLVELQKFAFYARYGDILAEVCNKLKQEAIKREVDGYQSLKGFWSKIDERIQNEKPFYKKLLEGVDCHKDCTTHIAVYQACAGVGFEMKDTLEFIHHYAVRNSLLHANIAAMIKDGKFSTLARVLYNDFCDIPKVISASEGVEAPILSTLLKKMIEKWFTFKPMDVDNYEAWKPSEILENYREELLGENPKTEAALNQEITKSVVDGLRQRRKEARDAELVSTLDTSLVLAPPSIEKRIKRVRSEEYHDEFKKVDGQTKKWKRLVDLATGTRNASQSYLEQYGELAEAPQVVIDPLL